MPCQSKSEHPLRTDESTKTIKEYVQATAQPQDIQTYENQPRVTLSCVKKVKWLDFQRAWLSCSNLDKCMIIRVSSTIFCQSEYRPDVEGDHWLSIQPWLFLCFEESIEGELPCMIRQIWKMHGNIWHTKVVRFGSLMWLHRYASNGVHTRSWETGSTAYKDKSASPRA